MVTDRLLVLYAARLLIRADIAHVRELQARVDEALGRSPHNDRSIAPPGNHNPDRECGAARPGNARRNAQLAGLLRRARQQLREDWHSYRQYAALEALVRPATLDGDAAPSNRGPH